MPDAAVSSPAHRVLLECLSRGEYGVTQWDRWCHNNPDTGRDLRGVCFPHRSQLQGIDLCSTDLTGADLHAAMSLWDARLNGATLAHADLQCLEIRHSEFLHSDLTGADLSCCTLVRVDFTRSVLREVNFSGAQLHQCILADTDCTRAEGLTPEMLANCFILGIKGVPKPLLRQVIRIIRERVGL